jgi:NTE family protein
MENTLLNNKSNQSEVAPVYAKRKTISLALQGGGSHGAFTWGVLDRLLEDQRICLEGISGASAGALNAVVLANGLVAGGRDGAREALKVFWESVATREPFTFTPGTSPPNSSASHMSALKAFLFWSRFYSPYQLNPFNLNPLRDILSRQIDFERLRAECTLSLFVAATAVETGMPRLFRNSELTLDVLLASSCLPQLHHSVQIDGVAYWDGGLTANPPVRPLLYKCAADDILVVLLNPFRRSRTPATADAIFDRMTEISFTSAFYAELQGIAMAKQEAEDSSFSFGTLERRLKRLKMHLIDSQALMSELEPLSKLDTHASFIKALYEEGRTHAHAWLETNYQHIGVRSSFALADHLY